MVPTDWQFNDSRHLKIYTACTYCWILFLVPSCTWSACRYHSSVSI